MAYQDWEKYHNSKASSGVKRTTAKSQSVKSKKSTSSATSKKTVVRKRTTKRKVANKKKKFSSTPKNTLIMLLIGTSLTGILYNVASEMKLDVDISTTEPTSNVATQGTYDSVGGIGINEEQVVSTERREYTEEELLDYKEYCYVGGYGSKDYLFCPEEYVLALAEYSIDKLNELYKSSGHMPLLSNGECIPDCITPELVSAICFTESSYRVESTSGLPLGADRNCDADDRAEGILQQKPAFVIDANRYSCMYGGDGYTLEDRYNPLKAMEMCVTNLTRIYRAYLQKGCDTYNNLGAKSPQDDVLLGALIVAYNQGEGSMQKWAKSGKLAEVLANPNSTDNYGANYYRAVMDNLEDILEEDYSK